MVLLGFKILFQHLPGGIEETMKTSVRIPGFRVKNQNWDLLSMKQEC
jgi:hypothetical protein